MSIKIPYTNIDEFILRTPLFPIEFVRRLTEKDNISDEEIISLCKTPIINEAIYIASPPLYYEMQKWIEGKLGNGKKTEKKVTRLRAGLLRYFFRMSTRCTPFGLFAGFATGRITEKVNIQLMPREQYIRHTRLDMNYLCALAIDLSKHVEIKGKLKFYPNSSIYVVGDNLRYVEFQYINSKRSHHIISVDNSEYLQLVLNRAKEGAYMNDLAELLVDDEISIEEALVFIDELIDSQLLVSELDPAVTGDELLDRILFILKGLPSNEILLNVINVLSNVKLQMEGIIEKCIDNPVSVYENIAGELKQLGTKYELKYLFQTDMVIPTEDCTLNIEVVNDIQIGMEVLNKLSLKNSEGNLTKFIDAFRDRYEDEEVPLLQALDTESGIGYIQNLAGDITPLVDDLVIGSRNSNSSDMKWNNVYTIFQRKYLEALKLSKKVIHLTEEDLVGLEADWNDLPYSVSAMVQLLNNPEDGKVEVCMKSVGGSSAANLIGRFCHSDIKAHSFVNKIIEKDESQDDGVIFAEIAHLPESRTGNILLRPTLRNFEIPYLAKSSVDIVHQIDVNDLYLSVKRDEIILRSKKFNKIIVPRLTSAHNFSFNALPVYQFLCDLQTQKLRGGFGFGWGPLAQLYKFLPRVKYKNVILSRATWNINKNDIESILDLKNEKEQADAFRLFAEKQNIPREVLLSESDNELYLNLANNTCTKILLDQVKKKPSFTLVEFIFDSNNSVVKGVDGGTTNEFVFAFYKSQN